MVCLFTDMALPNFQFLFRKKRLELHSGRAVAGLSDCRREGGLIWRSPEADSETDIASWQHLDIYLVIQLLSPLAI